MTKTAVVGARGHLGMALADIIKLSGSGAAHACEICGVCGDGADATAARLRDAGVRVAPDAVHSDGFQRMLDAARPQVLIICSPLEEHAHVASMALSARIHCFCEKPAASTLEGLAELETALSRSPGVRLAQMCGPHYDAGMWDAARLAGAIGPPRVLSAQKSYKLGRREDFFMRRETSSGIFPWVAIHAISWLYHFSGRRAMKPLAAAHSACDNCGFGDLEVSAAALFDCGGGVCATLTADYLRPENPAVSHGDDRLRAAAPDGVIDVLGGVCRLVARGRDETHSTPPPRGMFEDFLRAVNGLDSDIMLDTDVIRVTRAALLAREMADACGRSAPGILHDAHSGIRCGGK